MKQFPLNRSTSLGRRFVNKMYRWFLFHQPGLALAAEIDGRVAGFVVGAIGGYGRKIFRYAFPELVLGVLTHPQIIFRRRTFMLWQSYLKGLLPSGGSRPIPRASAVPVYAGLSSIAVDPAFHRKGVGRALVAAFEAAAKEQGASRVGLSVERENLAARQTYEGCGWEPQAGSNDSPSIAYYKDIS